MPAKEGFQGVANCYIFKSRLQEYAQKVGLPTPVYETIKEGASHEPTFRSTVTVKEVKYYSLPGFSNRKAAEQSAAEVALLELSKSSDSIPHVSAPVHETGLCKNMLQEYAQKMNYANPLYQFDKDDGGPGKGGHLFSCTVEFGGIRYIGAAAKTKKEAEIKAARTALLAIQSSSASLSDRSQLTVVPCKRNVVDPSLKPKTTTKAPKTKKGRFKKYSKKKGQVKKEHIVPSNLESNIDGSSNMEPPLATEVVPMPSATEVVPMPSATEVVPMPSATEAVPMPSAELASHTTQNSECRTTNQGSSGDGHLVSNIQSASPLANLGFSGDLFSNQMNCAISDAMSFPLNDVQPTCGEAGKNVTNGVTEELQ